MSEENLQQDSVIETDSADVQNVDTQSVETEQEKETAQVDSTSDQVTEQVESKENEKIKIGERELTPTEIEEALKVQETQKAEAEKNAYQPRELAVIEADLARENANLQADITSLQKRFVAKAETPIIGQDDNGEAVLANYTPEQAYEHGLKTGDWKYFISCLSSTDAVEFENDRMKLAQDYTGKLEFLTKEKEYISFQENKKADLQKWDSYIETNLKDKPAEKYLINKVKANFDFDEEGTKNFVQWVREAIEIEKNQADLGVENDSAKQAMMTTTIGGKTNVQGSTKIFTADEIGRMSPIEFARHEKTIDEQYKKGLIK